MPGPGAVQALHVVVRPPSRSLSARWASHKSRTSQGARWPCRGRRQAKESQLETEAMAVGGFEVSGVVPPFRPEVGMVEVIAGELVAVSRQRRLVLPAAPERRADSSSARKPTPHGPPRWGSAEWRCARGKARQGLLRRTQTESAPSSTAMGQWNWIVQPNDCLLMTKMSSSESTNPSTSPATLASRPSNPASIRMSLRTCAVGSTEKAEQPEFAAAIDHERHQSAGDAHDRNDDRHRFERIGDREGAIENSIASACRSGWRKPSRDVPASAVRIDFARSVSSSPYRAWSRRLRWTDRRVGQVLQQCRSIHEDVSALVRIVVIDVQPRNVGRTRRREAA